MRAAPNITPECRSVYEFSELHSPPVCGCGMIQCVIALFRLVPIAPSRMLAADSGSLREASK